MNFRLLSRSLLVVVLSSSSLFALSGCRDESRSSAPYSPLDPAREWVETWRHDADDALRARAESRASARAMRAILEKEAPKGWTTRVETSIKYADLFLPHYAERGWSTIASRHDGLSPRGTEILSVLKSHTRHHIEEPMNYHIERITALDASLAASSKDAAPWPSISFSPHELEALATFVHAQKLDVSKSTLAHDALVDALAGTRLADSMTKRKKDLPASPIPRVTSSISSFVSTLEPMAETMAQLELYTVDGALRWARDMKHFNLVRQSWKDLKDAGGSKKLIYGRLRGFFDLLAASKPSEIRPAFDALQPQTPQYTYLLAARARYAEIVERGGWQEVASFRLVSGATHPRAHALRTRLAIEGYLPEASASPDAIELTASTAGARIEEKRPEKKEANRIVDAPLLAAVRAYHETHQLAYDPESSTEVSRAFWRSLNLPATRRLSQIDLALKRWRRSRYEGEADFVFINLPDFHAEVFADHERAMRFRVVIGKNNRVCDPETETWTYPNATPELMSKLEYFILNPSWYVPQRIVEEEIKPAVEENEEWLEKNHYVLESVSGETWKVRQIPGEHNALGVVKFIFPNPHNTYMHDTAKKRYFDYTLRAYSHGCMRVQEPLSFAKYLATIDGKEDLDIDGLIASGQSKMIDLEKELPVFVEYHTVRIDGAGRPVFLADIYDRDARDASDNPGAAVHCNAPKQAPSEAEEESAPDDLPQDLGP